MRRDTGKTVRQSLKATAHGGLVVPRGLGEKPETGYWVTESAPASLVQIPDIHHPVHDPRALAACLEFVEEKRPERALQIGDCYDFFSVSSFLKEPARMRGYGGTLHEEVQSAKPFWESLLRSCKRVDFIPGNHEERLDRLITANPGLFAHPSFALEAVLELPERVVCHRYGAKLRIGNIVHAHGDKLRRSRLPPKYLAATTLQKYPNQNTVFGDAHRIDRFIQTTYNEDRPRDFFAACIGWLGDVKEAKYVSDPEWQQGFAYTEFWKDGSGRTRFNFHQIQIFDGKFKFGGKVYGGHSALNAKTKRGK